MANKIDILINMVKTGHGDDQAVTGLKKLSSSFESLTGMSLSAAGAMGLATKAIQFVANAVSETVDYAMDVKDFAMALGVTTEEASKLIQIGDDLRVSTETMSSGFRYALDHGIVPSVEGLADLSAQMLALETPTERMSFAIDKFGRAAGSEMMRVLEQGPEAIREMSDALEGSSLIMSQDAVDAAEEYRKTLDELNDAWMAFKVDIAIGLLSIGDSLNQSTNDWEEFRKAAERGIINEKEFRGWFNAVENGSKDSADALEWLTKKTEEYNDSILTADEISKKYGPTMDDMIEKWESTVTVTGEAAQGVADYSDALDEFQVAVNGKVGPAIEDFVTTQRELKAELSEVNSKIAYFRSLGDGMTDDQQTELDSLIGRYDELQTELQETEAEHKKMMANIVFDMMLRRAEMDGVITDTENAMLTSFAVTSGIWDEETANLYDSLTELMNNAGLSAEEASRLVDILYGKITSIEGTYDIEFQISVRGQMPEGAEFNPVTGDYSYAAGGSMLVPPGYPNDSFMIGVSSGEYVNVVPSSEVINNYSLTLNEAGSRGNVVQDFALLKSLAAV